MFINILNLIALIVNFLCCFIIKFFELLINVLENLMDFSLEF